VSSRLPLSHVWICVPTYNEAEGIGTFLKAVLAMIDDNRLDAHILVADDNSPDGTGQIIERLAEEDTRIEVLHRPGKQGIGPAYAHAFQRALEGGAEVIVQMDSDLAHDPAAVPSLLAELEDADVVLGSRYVPGGSTVNWRLARRVISKGGCSYARTVLGLPVRDLTGGFKCFRRHVLETLPLDDLGASGYGFQIEMTYLALRHGFRVAEVPITFTERTVGRSKMSLGITLEAALLVLRLRLGALYGASSPGSRAPEPVEAEAGR
jgi:dolichol-phosphate mannosyltransferase